MNLRRELYSRPESKFYYSIPFDFIEYLHRVSIRTRLNSWNSLTIFKYDSFMNNSLVIYYEQ